MSSGLIALLAIVALGAMFMGRDAAAQTNFFSPCSTLQFSSVAPDAPATIKGQFGISLDPATCTPFGGVSERPPNWNSGGLINFTPEAWGVAKDADIPDGTKIGSFNSKAILGLFNNGCQTIISVPFDLYDGTTNRTNKIDAKAPGEPDRLSPLKELVDGKPAAAVKWPSYLDNLTQRNGMQFDGLVARFVGVNSTAVTGTTVVLNFLVFKPGSTISRDINLDPRLGYAAVTVLQDPSAAASSKDPVSDFCAPLWTSFELLGEAGGATFRKNPAAGSYSFITWVLPAPDADNDGIENGFDPCPIDKPNASGWDPRGPIVQNPGEQDGDGLPDDCDPNPTEKSPCNAKNGISNADEDCDGWQNRGDNCPLAKNEDQADEDGDGLGDACDPNKSTDDGLHAPICLVKTITIGGSSTTAVAGTAPTFQPCGTDPLPGPPGQGGGATPTLGPGATPRPTGGVGPVDPGGYGVGSLAPTGSDAPMWATALAALGVVGLAIGLGLMGSRLLRRRE